MTHQEISDRIGALRGKRDALYLQLEPLCHAAVNVLKDAGHPSSAIPLEAKLSELDAVKLELESLVRENAEDVLIWERILNAR